MSERVWNLDFETDAESSEYRTDVDEHSYFVVAEKLVTNISQDHKYAADFPSPVDLKFSPSWVHAFNEDHRYVESDFIGNEPRPGTSKQMTYAEINEARKQQQEDLYLTQSSTSSWADLSDQEECSNPGLSDEPDCENLSPIPRDWPFPETDSDDDSPCSSEIGEPVPMYTSLNAKVELADGFDFWITRDKNKPGTRSHGTYCWPPNKMSYNILESLIHFND